MTIAAAYIELLNAIKKGENPHIRLTLIAEVEKALDEDPDVSPIYKRKLRRMISRELENVLDDLENQ